MIETSTPAVIHTNITRDNYDENKYTYDEFSDIIITKDTGYPAFYGDGFPILLHQ